MKTKNILLAFVIAVSSMMISCKSKQETSKTETKSSAGKGMAYRLTVSFISKGAGFDSKKKNAFLSYVDNHPKKPAYKFVQWGKEGETDYCFTLSELSAAEQTDFVNEIKNKMSGSDLVLIAENAECTHFAR